LEVRTMIGFIALGVGIAVLVAVSMLSLRSPRKNIGWMREGMSRVAHAFATIDLCGRSEQVEPVAPCGRFLVADLQEDELADRCSACKRALRVMR